MSITLKARCVKCCFKKEDYRIFSWSPIDHSDDIKLSNFFTFSTKGNDSYIDENKDYEIEIEEISYDKRYGGTYKILSVPSMSNFDISQHQSSISCPNVYNMYVPFGEGYCNRFISDSDFGVAAIHV